MSSDASNAVFRRFRAAIVAFGAGLFMLGMVPKVPRLESADRRLLTFLLKASGGETGKVRILGTGDYDNPRAVCGVPSVVSEHRIAVPQFLAFTDDPDGIFQSTPPGPADLAVVLANLHELGHRKLAVATPLAWEKPDRLAASALDYELGRFSPGIVGIPLVRGIKPSALPEAFLRLSVPVEAVQGGVRSLPVVNQLAIPDPRLGGASTWAAFTRLENEEDPEFGEGAAPVRVPLLARWGERVVVALPLALAMARFDVEAGDLLVRPGCDIRLGEFGPIVPIDEFGRMLVTSGAAKRVLVVPAEETVRAPGEKAPESLKPGEWPVVLRDDSSGAPPAEKLYSEHLADILVALDHAPRSNFLAPLPRPPVAFELFLVGLFAGLAAWLCCLPGKFRHPLFFLLMVGALALSSAMLATVRLAPPPLAVLAAPLGGWLACLRSGRPSANEENIRDSS